MTVSPTLNLTTTASDLVDSSRIFWSIIGIRIGRFKLLSAPAGVEEVYFCEVWLVWHSSCLRWVFVVWLEFGLVIFCIGLSGFQS